MPKAAPKTVEAIGLQLETNFATPIGTFIYPHVQTPFTKFKDDGEYSCMLRLSPGRDAAFLTQLEELYKQCLEQMAAAEKIPLSKLKRADPPYKQETDRDSGEETGEVLVKTKAPATFKDKNTKQIQKASPPAVVDAKKNPVKAPIGTGSEGRLVLQARPFYVPAIGAGMSLRLKAVQVTSLVAPKQGGTEMFDTVEGGYVDETDTGIAEFSAGGHPTDY